MLNEKLNVRSKSVATAAAIMIATGIKPKLLRRRDEAVTFEFPPTCEAALLEFLKAKQVLDRLAEEPAS